MSSSCLVLQKEKATTCRIDHYQTLSDVHVSIFAKNVDKDSCVVKFEETEVRSKTILI